MTEHEDLTTVGPATAATVAYKGWVTTASGREAIEIVLPLGAPAYLLEQAIEQWQQMRAAAQAATAQASAPPSDPRAVVVTFGKHQGKTLGEIERLDLSYLEWLHQAAREAHIRQAAGDVLTARREHAAQLAGELAAQLDQPPAPAEPDAGDVPF